MHVWEAKVVMLPRLNYLFTHVNSPFNCNACEIVPPPPTHTHNKSHTKACRVCVGCLLQRYNVFLNSLLFHICEFHQTLLDFTLFIDGLWPAVDVALGTQGRNITAIMNIEKKCSAGFWTRCIRMMDSPAWAQSRYSTKRCKRCHTRRTRARRGNCVSAQRLSLIKDALSGEVDNIIGARFNTLRSIVTAETATGLTRAISISLTKYLNKNCTL